jgi:hypothetical protein
MEEVHKVRGSMCRTTRAHSIRTNSEENSEGSHTSSDNLRKEETLAGSSKTNSEQKRSNNEKRNDSQADISFGCSSTLSSEGSVTDMQQLPRKKYTVSPQAQMPHFTKMQEQKCIHKNAGTSQKQEKEDGYSAHAHHVEDALIKELKALRTQDPSIKRQ